MAHPFLSPEWIAAVREIRDRHADAAAEAELPIAVKVNQIITDVPFGTPVHHAHIDTTQGAVIIEEGHLDRADVTVTMDYSTARTLFVDQDPQAAMQAFLGGKIKVQGDIAKLLAMQTMTPDPRARQIADEVRAVTG